MAGLAVANSATEARWIRRSNKLALALMLLGSCAPSDSGVDAGEVLFAWQETQRPKPEQKVERQRPPQPKPQPRPEPQRPPDPPGSGDAIPVAATTVEPGSAIGGMIDAMWADLDNDGYVDGYVVNGQYYAGMPPDYDSILHRVVTGGSLGAAAGAIIPVGSVLEGARIGAAVSGLAGAIWADRDHDGRVDGYVRNGQYFPGAPPPIVITPAPLPDYSGERG